MLRTVVLAIIISISLCASARELNGIRIEYHSQRPGGDYADSRVENLAQCVNRCAGAYRCVAFDYRLADRRCSLKDQFTPRRRNDGMVSGSKRLWRGALHNAEEVDGVLIEYDTQRRGGDYRELRVTHVGDCARLCAYDRRCRGFGYEKKTGICSLKNRAAVTKTNPKTVSGIKYGQGVGQPRTGRR